MPRAFLFAVLILAATPCLAAEFDLNEFYARWLAEETATLDALHLLEDDTLLDKLEPLAGDYRAELTDQPEDWRAAAFLGLGYHFGLCGAPNDSEIARVYLLRACRHGPPEAGYFVAFYSVRRAVWLDDPFVRNRAKLDCLRMQSLPTPLFKAAASGFAPAQALAAHLVHVMGEDNEHADEWLMAAANAGCRPAKLWHGWQLYMSETRKDCLAPLEEIYTQKDARGAYALGFIHDPMLGEIEPNLLQARAYYEKSLKLGYTPAKWRLDALPETALENLKIEDIPELYRKGWRDSDTTVVDAVDPHNGLGWKLKGNYHVCPANQIVYWYPAMPEWLEKQPQLTAKGDSEIACYLKLAYAEFIAFRAWEATDEDNQPISPLDLNGQIDLDLCPEAAVRGMEWSADAGLYAWFESYMDAGLLSDHPTVRRWYALASIDGWKWAYFSLDRTRMERDKSIEELRRLAKAGDPLSAHALGAYSYDPAIALTWHENAAKRGCAASAHYCVRAYTNGIGTDVNTSKAAEWLKVVEADSPQMGRIAQAAQPALRAAVLKEEWQARATELEREALAALNKHAGFDEFMNANPRAATVAQRADSAGLLALCYVQGHGVSQDFGRVQLLLKDTSGILQSYMTGWIHEHGLNIAQPFGAGAVICYESIADQPAAAYRLGVIYRAGELVAQDDSKASGFFAEAADGGCIPAMLETAKAYHAGTGVEADTEKARSWAKKAADAGNDEAAKLLEDWK